jgi:hypothetical protein
VSSSSGLSVSFGFLVLSLGFDGSSSLGISVFVQLLFSSSSSFIEGIQSLHELSVLQGVVLGLVVENFTLSD